MRHGYRIVGVLFLAAGAAGVAWAWRTDSAAARWIGLAAAALAIVGIVCLVVARYPGGLDTSSARRNGIPGTAEVLATQDTGVTINNVTMVMRARLLVSIPGRQPYEADVRHLMRGRRQWGAIQPGMTVPVRVDADDPSVVAIELERPVAATTTPWAPAVESAGGSARVLTISAADIIAKGIKVGGTLLYVTPSGVTAGQASSDLPPGAADDPVVHVVFTYRDRTGRDARHEALVRVPDGKAGYLVPGGPIPVAFLPGTPTTATIDWTRL